MKKLITLISIGFLLAFTGCTKQGVKNRALVMSVENFDNDAQLAAKATFVDQEQQKAFADFIKMNTKIDVDNVEMQSDDEATARLTIVTFSKSVYPELVTISGKDWKTKIADKMETKHYNLKLKKADNAWKITEKTEAP
jgi:hypothetical protein